MLKVNIVFIQLTIPHLLKDAQLQEKLENLIKKVALNFPKLRNACSANKIRKNLNEYCDKVYSRPSSNERPIAENFILKLNTRHNKLKSKESSWIIKNNLKLKLTPFIKKMLKIEINL